MKKGGRSVEIFLIQGMPKIKEGDDLASIIESNFSLESGDVVCIASTIVSKSEGRIRSLEAFCPTQRAFEIAKALGKDPRFVQAVLDESKELLLQSPFILSATRFGHIGVNAGIDQSNVGEGSVLLLPVNPSASASLIRSRFIQDCAVIITDTCGRPFRCGVAGIALGCSGIAPLKDWRGSRDIYGRALEITQEAIADEVAAMANFLMGEAGDGTPVAVFRGLEYPSAGGTLFRPASLDVIRRNLKE